MDAYYSIPSHTSSPGWKTLPPESSSLPHQSVGHRSPAGYPRLEDQRNVERRRWKVEKKIKEQRQPFSLILFPFGTGAAEAIHDRPSQANFGNRFRQDQVQA